MQQTAARSLVNLFREIDPTMLHRRKRGKEASMATLTPLQYGATSVAEGVANVGLLERYRARGEHFLEPTGVVPSENEHSESSGDNGDDDGDDDERSESSADESEEVLADDDAVAREQERIVGSDDDEQAATATVDTARTRFDARHIMTDRDFEDLDRAIELVKDAQSNAIKRKKFAL